MISLSSEISKIISDCNMTVDHMEIPESSSHEFDEMMILESKIKKIQALLKAYGKHKFANYIIGIRKRRDPKWHCVDSRLIEYMKEILTEKKLIVIGRDNICRDLLTWIEINQFIDLNYKL